LLWLSRRELLSGECAALTEQSDLGDCLMKRILAAVAFAVALTCGSVAPSIAGPYDGQWLGRDQGGACSIMDLLFYVTDYDITGKVLAPNRHVFIHSKLQADGSIWVTIHGKAGFEGVIRFTSTTFDGQLQSQCGMRHIVGKRIGDAGNRESFSPQ
jgi:hypothetical protein